MQDVFDVPADRARTSAEARLERMTGGQRLQPSADALDEREPAPRELLDTRLVRAELARLRRPGARATAARSG